MPVHAVQRNFNSGELGPLLDARADTDKWRGGLARCENFLLTPAGPIRRRMGYKFVAAAKFPDRECRVIGFQASRAEGYCIELGHLYMRFHRLGIPVLDEDNNPYEIETPWPEEEIFNIQWDSVNDLLFMANQETPVQILSYFSRLDWEINPMAFDWPPMQDENVTNTTMTITSVTDVPIITTEGFNVTTGGTDITSGILTASGPVTSVVNFMDVDPPLEPGAYYRLEGSTDGGVTWGIIRTFTVAGTFNDTFTGQVRMIANFYKLDATLSTSIDNPEISVGDVITVSASSPLFTAQSVGRSYSIGHQRTVNELRLALQGNSASGVISVLGKWSLLTVGTWFGALYVDRSRDGGATWETILERISYQDRNISYEGDEFERVLLRMRFYFYGDADGARFATISVDESMVEGVFEVTAYTSPTQVAAVVTSPILSQAPTRIWRKGAWSTETGYPNVVQWHANRLVFGGTKDQGSTLWFSAIEDYYVFKYGIEDDEAFAVTLGGTQQENIEWLCSRGDLAIGTSGGEWVGRTTADERVVTPTSFAVESQTSYGGEPVAALVANNTIIFVQATARKVREFAFSLADNSYDGADLTQLAIHVTKGGIRDMSLQRQRDTNVWCTLNSGNQAGMIYERAQAVVGWHVHKTQGNFGSTCTVLEEGEEDSIYAVVRREVDGETVRYIERQVPNQLYLMESSETKDMAFMDSYAEYEFPDPGDLPEEDIFDEWVWDEGTDNGGGLGVDSWTGIRNGEILQTPALRADINRARVSMDCILCKGGVTELNKTSYQASFQDGHWYDGVNTPYGHCLFFVVNVDLFKIGEFIDRDSITTGNMAGQFATLRSKTASGIGIYVDTTANISSVPPPAWVFPGPHTYIIEMRYGESGSVTADDFSLYINGHFIVSKTTANALKRALGVGIPSPLDYNHTSTLERKIYSILAVRNHSGYNQRLPIDTIVAAREYLAKKWQVPEAVLAPHLIGKLVQVLADGVDAGDQLVNSDGYVQIPGGTQKAFVGLGYTSLIESLPLTIQLRDGDSQGRLKRVYEAWLRVWKSVGAEVAPIADYEGVWEPLSESDRSRVSNRAEVQLGELGNLEDWRFHMPGNSDSAACIAVRQSRPFPLNIISLQAVFNPSEK